jgi:hypothetical protein
MKHAGPAALDRLEPLLETLRRNPGLELFADIRLADDFERLPATKAAERAALLKLVAGALGDGKATPARSTSVKRK